MTDEDILDILRQGKKKGKSVSAETIAFNTNILPVDIYEKLEGFEKRGKVRKTTARKVSFFEILDDDDI